MAYLFLNRARMSVASAPGTGSIALGSAASGFQSFSSAGATTGDTFSYVAEDGLNWEIGTGTYSSSGPSLARTTITQTSAGGTSPLTLSASTIVTATIRGSDIGAGTLAGLSDVSVTEGAGIDGKVLTWVNSAGKWQAVAGGAANPPNLTTFNYEVLASGVTVSTSYVASKGLSVRRTDTTGGDVASFRGTAVPGTTPWSATAQVRILNGSNAYFRGGIGLYDSVSTKGMLNTYNTQNTSPNAMAFYMGAGLSGFTSTIGSVIGLANYGPALFEWFRISFDGTTYTFGISIDGGTFFTLGTATAASYFTATHVGLVSESYGGLSSDRIATVSLINWTLG